MGDSSPASAVPATPAAGWPLLTPTLAPNLLVPTTPDASAAARTTEHQSPTPLTDPPPLRRDRTSQKRPRASSPLPSAVPLDYETSLQRTVPLDFGCGTPGDPVSSSATPVLTMPLSVSAIMTGEAWTTAPPPPPSAGSQQQNRPRRQAAAAAAIAAATRGVALPGSGPRTRRRRRAAGVMDNNTGDDTSDPVIVPTEGLTTAPPLPPSAAADAAAIQLCQARQGAAAGDSAVAAAVLRCDADLERAVAHLRARDPRLVPLIDAHGLPHSLVACSSAAVAAETTAATAAAAAGAAEGASGGGGGGGGAIISAAGPPPPSSSSSPPPDLSLGCGKGSRSSGTMAAAAAGGGGGGGADGPWGSNAGGGGRNVFAALARSVVYQQLATNAASAIWGRVLKACKADSGESLTPRQLLAAPPEQLRAAGLSGRKVEYLTGLAAAFSGREGWDEQLAATSDLELLVSELTALRGIGSWTVHMLAMFHLGLPDVLPVGDLGVRRGLQLLHGLRELPGPGQVEALTEAWRPYRSVGSWYMWRIPPPPRTAAGAGKKAAGAAVSKRAKGRQQQQATTTPAAAAEGAVVAGRAAAAQQEMVEVAAAAEAAAEAATAGEGAGRGGARGVVRCGLLRWAAVGRCSGDKTGAAADSGRR